MLRKGQRSVASLQACAQPSRLNQPSPPNGWAEKCAFRCTLFCSVARNSSSLQKLKADDGAGPCLGWAAALGHEHFEQIFPTFLTTSLFASPAIAGVSKLRNSHTAVVGTVSPAQISFEENGATSSHVSSHPLGPTYAWYIAGLSCHTQILRVRQAGASRRSSWLC